MTQKFSTGAFVFTRTRGLEPRDPADLQPVALQHGIALSFIPSYPGDRVTIMRAITHASRGLADDDSLRALLDLGSQPPTATITLDELRQAQAEVASLPLTDDTREAIISIKHALEEEGIAASDRRWEATANLVRAKSWLEGDSQTCADHCEILIHALWSDPGQQRVVERAVSKIVNPLNLEAVELEDAAKDLFDQKPTPDAAPRPIAAISVSRCRLSTYRSLQNIGYTQFDS